MFRNVLQEQKVPLALLGVSCACVFFAGVLFFTIIRREDPIEFVTPATSQPQETVVVDIEGAVEAPGVYELPRGSRVEDLLTRAGGVDVHADTEYISRVLNRAAILEDGAKVYVPYEGEVETSHNSNTVNAPLTSHNKITQTEPSKRISINSAPQILLETLPGVGPKTAEKIISNRPYRSLEELVEKNAVGKSLYEKIIGMVEL